MRIPGANRVSSIVGLVLWLAPIGTSVADASCQTTKVKTATKYTSCRLGADQKAAKAGTLPDYTRCEQRFTDKWARAEGQGSCVTVGDASSVRDLLATHAFDLSTLLQLLPPCGDDLFPTCGGACPPGRVCAARIDECGFPLLQQCNCETEALAAAPCACGQVFPGFPTTPIGLACPAGDVCYVDRGSCASGSCSASCVPAP